MPQKLLVLAIVACVGCGYLAALANVFAQDAGADGKQTIQLEDFRRVYSEMGVGGLVKEVQNSLGLADVIKKYHGTGGGTRLEASLNGTMRHKIVEGYNGKDQPDAQMAAYCETLRQDIIAWSHLPVDKRRFAYDRGVPTKGEEGFETIDFAKLEELFGKASAAEQKAQKKPAPEPAADGEVLKVEGVPVQLLLGKVMGECCTQCHATGSSDAQATKMPLENFAQLNAYCSVDNGVSLKQLALTSHVHLLGFAVLFAMSGFLMSLTSYSSAVRFFLAPSTLVLQICEIACWWLAKLHVGFAYGIFYLGPAVGASLALQLLLILLDLLFRRRRE